MELHIIGLGITVILATLESERENLGIKCLENSRLLENWPRFKALIIESVLSVTNLCSLAGNNKNNRE